MSDTEVRYGDLIGKGWDITGKQRGFWAGVTLVVILISFLLNKYVPSDAATTFPVISFLVNMIINSVLTIGLVRMSLKAADGKTVEFSDLYADFGKLPQYIGASLIYTVMVAVGLILLIIPGIFVALSFSQFTYFIVDKNAGVIESLKLSYQATQGMRLKILVLGVLLGLINILGAVALFIGLFWTIPTSLVASALLYRLLVKNMKAIPANS